MPSFWNFQDRDAQRGLIAASCFFAAVVVAGFFTAFLSGGGMAAQRVGRMPQAGGGEQAGPLWTLATPLDDGRQMLLVVDQQNRALAIYHVDPATGSLTLKSTRDISWDLLVEDFNCQEPRPAALKKMLEVPK